MKSFAILIFVSSVAATGVRAGEVFGTVTEGGKPVAAGVSLKLTCPGASAPASARTDSYGSYRLRGALSGKCTLQLEYKKETPSLEVVVYEKPARYDLVVSVKDGKSVVERK